MFILGHWNCLPQSARHGPAALPGGQAKVYYLPIVNKPKTLGLQGVLRFC